MKNKTTLLWIFILLSTISTSALITLVLVKPNFPPQRQHSNEFDSINDMSAHHHQFGLMETLNLNENQITLFIQEKNQHLEKVRPLFDSITTIRSELFTELKTEKPDSTKINSYLNKIVYLEKQFQLETIHHMLNLKSFLQPEQVDSMFSFFSRKMMPGHFGQPNKGHRNQHRHCNY